MAAAPLQLLLRRDSFCRFRGRGEDVFVVGIKSVEGRAKFGTYETWYRISGDLKAKKKPVFILHGGPGGPIIMLMPISS